MHLQKENIKVNGKTCSPPYPQNFNLHRQAETSQFQAALYEEKTPSRSRCHDILELVVEFTMVSSITNCY